MKWYRDWQIKRLMVLRNGYVGRLSALEDCGKTNPYIWEKLNQVEEKLRQLGHKYMTLEETREMLVNALKSPEFEALFVEAFKEKNNGKEPQ